MGRMILSLAVMLLLGSASSSTAPLQSPPTAENIVITVAPGETVLIPFAGSDPDGNLFGFMPTSGLSNPSAGTLRTACVCSGTYFGEICFCTSFFAAAADFSGSAAFTYRAIDATGLQSADATVTINSTVQTRTPEQILDEIEFIILRAIMPGGTIAPQIGPSLLAKTGAARAALGREDSTPALNQIHAFCNEVEAQAGKGILELALGLLRSLCGLIQETRACECQAVKFTGETVVFTQATYTFAGGESKNIQIKFTVAPNCTVTKEHPDLKFQCGFAFSVKLKLATSIEIKIPSVTVKCEGEEASTHADVEIFRRNKGSEEAVIRFCGRQFEEVDCRLDRAAGPFEVDLTTKVERLKAIEAWLENPNSPEFQEMWKSALKGKIKKSCKIQSIDVVLGDEPVLEGEIIDKAYTAVPSCGPTIGEATDVHERGIVNKDFPIPLKHP